MSRDYEKEIDESNLGEVYKKAFDNRVSKKTFERFEPFFNSNLCLEVGCYDGSVTNLILSKYKKIIAIDSSSTAIKMTEKNLPKGTAVKLKNQSLEAFLENPDLGDSMPIFSEPVDVFLMNVIEHLEDASKILSRLCLKLFFGSRIFIQVPNVDSLSRQIAARMGVLETVDIISDFEWNCGHRKNFSFDDLNNLLKRSGFSILNSFGVGLKTLSSAQFDKALRLGLIDEAYIEALFELDHVLPAISGSICFVAEKR